MYLAKLFLVALSVTLFIGSIHCFDFDETEMGSDKALWGLYERWSTYHNVSRHIKEKHRRFNVFKENAYHVYNTNNMNKTYKLKLNKFGDMSNEEFRAIYGSKIKPNKALPQTGFLNKDAVDLPASIDWRTKGAVTPVKYQGQCGSCWSFANTGAIEGINQITTGQLVSLSEQELIDCVSNNYGCSGGSMENGYAFVAQNGGISSEQNYPYVGQNGQCDTSKTSYSMVQIDGYQGVPPNDENALCNAVANQPVSVGIDGASRDFMLYSQGVFAGQCSTDSNHAVLVVGYDQTQDGTKYWIVKNSWGTTWGEQGYVFMQRDVDSEEGLCGIAKYASYPVKSH